MNAEIDYLIHPKKFIEEVLGYQVQPHHAKIFKHVRTNDRTLDLAPRGFGKSTVGDVAYVIWRIVQDRNLRVLIVSNTQRQAEAFIREIKNQLEGNEKLISLYGTFKKGNAKWTESELLVAGRTSKKKETTLTALGASGAVVSKHFDIVVCDDIVDFENARTELQRTKLKEWYYSSLLPTLEPDGEIHIVGCLPAGTKILMSEGNWKSIEQIQIGETVVSYKDGGLISQEVEAIIPQGEDSIYEIRTDHSKIKANNIHPFLVISPTNEVKYPSRRYSKIKDYELKWKKTEELKVDDILLMVKEVSLDKITPSNHTEDFMELFGFMVGDGWITPTNHNNGKTEKRYNGWHISFAKSEYDELNNRILSLLFDLDNKLVMKLTKNGYYLGVSKQIGEMFQNLGLKNGAKNKDIPDWIFKEPLKNRKAFIKGLVNADGWETTKYRKPEYYLKFPSYGIESASKKLINDLYLLCKTTGYTSSNIFYRARKIQPPNSPQPVDAESWSIKITEKSDIGMYRFIEAARTKFPNKNIKFETVQEIKECGKAEVYDLTIANTHNFIAEGFITHNTRYHPFDFYQDLINSKEYSVQIQRAILEDGSSLWPAKFSAEELTRKKEEAGSLIFSMQYQNSIDLAMQGHIFQYSWLQWYDQLPQNLKIYQGCDLAIAQTETADYFVICTIGIDSENKIYVLDMYRARLSFKEQMTMIQKKAEEWKPIRIGIESNTYQKVLSQELIRTTQLPIRQLTTLKDKVTRAQRRSAEFENGRVFLKKDMHLFVDELVLFPDSAHDDMFDGYEFARQVSDTISTPPIPVFPGISGSLGVRC